MRPRIRGLVLEGGPAVALTVLLVIVSPVAAPEPIPAAGYPLLAGAGLAAGLLRRAPLLAFALMLACTSAYLAAGGPDGPVYLAPLVGAAGVVAAHPVRIWVPAAVLSFVGPAVAGGDTGDGLSPSLAVGGLVWVGAAGVFSAFVRLRAAQAAQTSANALAEERLRIAREVHDVVGHSLAAISLQAGVAERLMDRRPQQAREAVAAIRAISVQALEEVRAELGMLRSAGEPAELGPAGGGLRAVPGLVATMREAGVHVDLDLAANGPEVPGPVGAAGFRIVQEALTNVVRHAGGQAQAHVRVAQRDGAIEIEVVDDGPDAPREPTPGNGLNGMRERTATLGGTFLAGARPQGGFRIFARLPLEPRA
ncbi:MAG: sensor histidine kinase [Actinomycetota bacterium]|nr:sensor histidine kinase [Actinomycetota bacterium]